MLHFENDYLQGAHPAVLQALMASNEENLPGYGADAYGAKLQDRLREILACSQAQVRLVAGGTQANALVIDMLLDDTEGVLAPDTGHVAVHEAGAIEHSRHKVITIPAQAGKLDASLARTYLENFYADETHPHMVFPGMIYISQPTEYGGLYSKAELEALAKLCQDYQIPLFVDGARLIYGLASPQNDVSLADLAQLADVFYIGGTKVGLLLGEALVFTKNNLPKRFDTLIKQRGALLAKGRVLSVQFEALFKDRLYLDIAQDNARHSQRLTQILHQTGFEFYLDSPTNQQFICLSKDQYDQLKEQVGMSYFGLDDKGQVVARLATAWFTTDADLDQLENLLRSL
ncbi:threonine aldolase family protein [Eremococcus coleocola]|uniref:threonine aldolase family protein n=1 Tax=Eremococcus coleocola TaxID=88132 RepID=UPI0005918027|nr:aminotransferase class I/II-fold pyridoxal phosphate-dependent enzyme [Eremococcus coleocola]